MLLEVYDETNKITFETHCEANEFHPFHQCRNVDDCGLIVRCLRVMRDKMRLRIRCELSLWKSSCLKMFVGESGDRCPRTYRGEERFPDMTITFALIQTVEKLAERSSPKLV